MRPCTTGFLGTLRTGPSKCAARPCVARSPFAQWTRACGFGSRQRSLCALDFWLSSQRPPDLAPTLRCMLCIAWCALHDARGDRRLVHRSLHGPLVTRWLYDSCAFSSCALPAAGRTMFAVPWLLWRSASHVDATGGEPLNECCAAEERACTAHRRSCGLKACSTQMGTSALSKRC